ncbi:MAG: proton-conducting transporter membrane subunit, partial [Candidatus Thorarchaeota archaeon]
MVDVLTTVLFVVALGPAGGALVSVMSKLRRVDTNAWFLPPLISLLSLIGTIFLLSEVSDGPVTIVAASLSVPWLSTSIGFHVDVLAVSFSIILSLFTLLGTSYGAFQFKMTRVGEETTTAARMLSSMLVMNSSAIVVFLALDLFTLLVAWEVTTLSLYLLIVTDREPGIAFKAFLMTHFGGILLLGLTIVLSTSTGTLSLIEMRLQPGLLVMLLPLIAPMLILAALPKSIQFPFHTWFTDSARAPASSLLLILAADLLGVYLLMRMMLQTLAPGLALLPIIPISPLVGEMNPVGLVVAIVGCITLIVGAVNALIESDLQRIVTFSASSELGFVFMMLGFTFPLATTAAIFYAISHTLVIGLLLACVGAVILGTGARRIEELGGLYYAMPITASFTALGVLAIGGLPLLSEFVGKYLVTISTIVIVSPLFLFVAVTGELVHIVVATRLLYSVFLARGKPSSDRRI